MRKIGHLSSYHIYSPSYGHSDAKMAHFFVFSADTSKKLVTVWAKYLNAPERSYWVLSKHGMVDRLWSEILRVETSKKLLSQQKNTKSCIFKGWNLANGSSEHNNPQHSLKELRKIF